MSSKENKIMKICQLQVDKVQYSYQMYRNNPYVPRNVHQFRVNMRKLRGLLNFLKPIMDEDMYNEINGMLRESGQNLSPLRDLDILIEECTAIAEEEPELVSNYADIFRFLEKERLKIIKRLSTKKFFEAFELTFQTVQENISEIEFNFENVKEENMDEFIDKRFDHKVNKLKELHKNLDDSDYEAVHDVRKQAKKVRYAAAGFKKVLSKKERKAVEKKAKKAQKELGKMTDKKVILDLLEEYKEKTSNDDVKESISTLVESYSA